MIKLKIADVSTYQGNVDWDTASSELDFVILRASVGTNTDSKYKTNVAALDRLGIPYHAYHYVKATTKASAKNEAKVFADATKGSKPLFYVIDAEYSGIKASGARAIMEEFESALRDYINKDIRVAIYIGHHLYKSWNLDYSRYAYVWIPRYGKDTGDLAGSTKPSYPCDLWQYTSKGRLAGIKGNVDLSTLNGDKPLSFFITEEQKPESTENVLQKGSKGNDVKYMQCALIALGYDLGKYGADGSFGKVTLAAVKKYQADHRYSQTGLVDESLYDSIFVSLTKAGVYH